MLSVMKKAMNMNTSLAGIKTNSNSQLLRR